MLKYLITAAMIFAATIPTFAADDRETQSLRAFSLADVTQDLNRSEIAWREIFDKIPGATHPKLKGPEGEHPKDKFLRLLQPQIWLLTDLNRDCSYTPMGISDNGLWVIGIETNRPNRFNQINSETYFILNVETEVKEALDFYPVGVTNDGEVFGGYYPAFTWTSRGGKQPLKSLNGYTMAAIQGISPNGRWVIGTSGQDFLIWDREAETIKAVGRKCWGTSISNNGIVIGEKKDKPMIYTPEKGMEFIPLPENYTGAYLLATTSDGSVCVGSAVGSDSIAAMWTQAESGKWQATLLGCLERDTRSHGVDISDNRTIIGTSNFKGFFWTQETGMVSIGQLLGGRSPIEFERYSPERITTDGMFILGSIDINSNTFIIPDEFATPDAKELQNSSLCLVYNPNFKAYMSQGVIPPFIKPFLEHN